MLRIIKYHIELFIVELYMNNRNIAKRSTTFFDKCGFVSKYLACRPSVRMYVCQSTAAVRMSVGCLVGWSVYQLVRLPVIIS